MTNQEKIALLEKFLKEEVGTDIKVHPEDELSDIGLDSLTIVEFQVYYEELTKKETPDKYTATKVSDLLEIM